jgi:hypothetical protein
VFRFVFTLGLAGLGVGSARRWALFVDDGGSAAESHTGTWTGGGGLVVGAQLADWLGLAWPDGDRLGWAGLGWIRCFVSWRPRVGGWHAGASVQALPALETAAENLVGGGAERETGREKDRFKVWDLFADERCS